jgi:hypothetical protein
MILFMCGCAWSRFIVSPEWITQSHAQGCLLPESRFPPPPILVTPEFGLKTDVSAAMILARKQQRQGAPMLHQYAFFVDSGECLTCFPYWARANTTQHPAEITPPLRILNQLIAHAGGLYVLSFFFFFGFSGVDFFPLACLTNARTSGNRFFLFFWRFFFSFNAFLSRGTQ